MRIVFNLKVTGLGNNGGSRTLIKCAETLQQLGHEVTLWCSANNYRWSKIQVPVKPKMPSCDVIVATGYSSVPTTVAAKVKRKFYYIRGFELWRAPEAKLLRSYKSLNCIVNSEWLQRYMRDKGISAHLVYPGVDFDIFKKEFDDRENILGGLFSKKHATKRHKDIISVGKRLGYQVLLLNRDIKNPDPENLRSFYNRVKVWMSPSELEGLHNCPFEAAACGSSLVVTNHKHGGVSDYAIDGETALVYPSRQLDVAAKHVKQLMEDDALRNKFHINMNVLLKKKIGSREQNMEKMVRIFEGAQ
jgi:glycosyltransferase involved in cell wall biosynthesis